MKDKNFNYPYIFPIFFISAVLIFIPILSTMFFDTETYVINNPDNVKVLLLISSFLAVGGLIYTTLGLHNKTIRGDELKLQIHLESLHVTFTAILISFFLLIFIFLNFKPALFNYIIVILAFVAIVTYLISSIIIKEKYK